jgi:hypothetical protein
MMMMSAAYAFNAPAFHMSRTMPTVRMDAASEAVVEAPAPLPAIKVCASHQRPLHL